MKRFLKWLAVAGPSVAMVIPLAPVVYAVVGGGVLGSLACFALGTVTYWAVRTVLNRAVELYDWFKHRNVYVEPPKPLPVPTATTYELDWTKINEGDRL